MFSAFGAEGASRHLSLRLCLKSPRHGVIIQRAAEQRSALRPKASLRALGNDRNLFRAAERRLSLICSQRNIRANRAPIAAPQLPSMVCDYPRLADSPWAEL